jgi:hypothetical protein
MVVEHHHFPRIGGVVHPMAAAVALAEEICVAHGFAEPGGAEARHRAGEHANEEAADALSLSPVTRRRLQADAVELLKKLQ